MNPPPVAVREIAREERFNIVWTKELNRNMLQMFEHLQESVLCWGIV